MGIIAHFNKKIKRTGVFHENIKQKNMDGTESITYKRCNVRLNGFPHFLIQKNMNGGTESIINKRCNVRLNGFLLVLLKLDEVI